MLIPAKFPAENLTRNVTTVSQLGEILCLPVQAGGLALHLFRSLKVFSQIPPSSPIPFCGPTLWGSSDGSNGLLRATVDPTKGRRRFTGSSAHKKATPKRVITGGLGYTHMWLRLETPFSPSYLDTVGSLEEQWLNMKAK